MKERLREKGNHCSIKKGIDGNNFLEVYCGDKEKPYFQALSSCCLGPNGKNKLKSVVGMLEVLDCGIENDSIMTCLYRDIVNSGRTGTNYNVSYFPPAPW